MDLDYILNSPGVDGIANAIRNLPNATQAAADNANAAAQAALAAVENLEDIVEERAVRYDEAQTLTDAQKAIGRGNIDAASVGDINNLKSALETITGNEEINFTWGYYINTSGSTVNINSPTSSSAGYGYAVVDASEGDEFTINSAGGNNPRAWCFIDASGNTLFAAGAGISASDKVITAPENSAKLVINAKTTDKQSFIGRYIKDDAQNTKDDIWFDEYLINNGMYTIKASDLESGQWSYYKKEANAKRARTKKLFPVRAGMIITYENTTFDVYFGILEAPTSSTYIQTPGWKTDEAGTVKVTKDGWMTFIIRNHANNDANVDPSDYDSVVAIITEVDNKIKSIYNVVDDLTTILTGSQFEWTYDKILTAGGELNDNGGYAVTNLVSVKPGTKIVNMTPQTDVDPNKPNMVIMGSFNNGVFVSGTRASVESGQSYTVDSNANQVMLCYGHISTYSVTMTKELVGQYFAVKMPVPVKPSYPLLDPGQPLYVAFGASTTYGAVHHFDNVPFTQSKYQYPLFVGDTLGLHAVNMGVGGTGLIARVYGDDNYMDLLYKNDDLLSKASLITMGIAYANDYNTDSDISLPIGSADDYYPYDEDGYHVTGIRNGRIAMINKGATWCGCLNWCLKWIGDHYPKAQPIVIYGRFAMNHYRTVEINANSDSGAGTKGKSPYKLTIADPVTDSAANVLFKDIISKINIPYINLTEDGGMPWSYYACEAKNQDGTYALFSTTGDSSDESTWTWNSHPNDDGYRLFARYIAGRVSALFYR